MRGKTVGQVVWVLAIVLLLFVFSGQASAAYFETNTVLTPSSGGGLAVSLLIPDNTYYNSADTISFRFVVAYNKSLSLSCTLLVDNSPAASINVTNGEEVSIPGELELSEGAHSWSARCSDATNNTSEASAKRFTVDLTSPTITLNTQDDALVLTDYFNVSFTPSDNIANLINCVVYIDSAAAATASIASQQVATAPISGVANGTHWWNVTCVDFAGNTGTSPTYSVEVDTQRNFSVTFSKAVFNIGESGIYWVTAPYGSEVVMLITTPKGETIIRNYTGTFPRWDKLEFLDNSGTYNIRADLRYKGAITTLMQQFEVGNSLNAAINIRSGSTKIRKGESVDFAALVSGGLGAISYTWEFFDKSDLGAGETIKHTFAEFGTYDVKLTVTDSKGNIATARSLIEVLEEHPVSVMVKSAATGQAIGGAYVYLDGVRKKADASGTAQYTVFTGTYQLFAVADYYSPYFNYSYLIDQPGDIIIYLRPTGDYNASVVEEPQATDAEQVAETPAGDVLIASDDQYAALQSQIADALASINQMDTQTKIFADAIRLQDSLESAQSRLQRMQRDLYNLGPNKRGLSAQQIEQEKAGIQEEYNEILRNTTESVAVIESGEFVKYPDDNAIKAISKDYLQFLNISENSKLTLLVKANQKAQSKISVNTKVKKATITYLDGSAATMILVIHELTVTGNVANTTVLVSIPKGVVSNSDELHVTGDYAVVKRDPILAFAPQQSLDISYTFKGDVAKEDLKYIDVIVTENPTTLAKQSGLTGFAIFKKAADIKNPVLVIEIIVIAILLLIFVYFEFDLGDRLKQGLAGRNPDLYRARKLIKDISKLLANNETDNALVVCEEFNSLHAKLSDKAKASIAKDAAAIKVKVDEAAIRNWIASCHKDIKDKKLQKARESYAIIMAYYKELDPRAKARVGAMCTELHKQLSEALKEP